MTLTSRRTRTIHPGLVTLAALVLLVAAVALTLLPVPVLLRSLIVVPALVLVAGQAATPFVIGRVPETGSELDRVLRASLPALLGMLVMLGAVLLTAVIGFDVDTTSIALSTAGAAAVLVLVSRWRTLVPGAARTDAGPQPLALPGARTVRIGAGVVASVLVLAAATAVAIELIPTPTERYSLMTIDDQPVLAGAPLQVAAGASTDLHWTLRTFGFPLGDAEPAVTVTVGGSPAVDVRSSALPASPGRADDVGATSRQSGTTTFTAPAAPGLYSVRLTVDDATSSPGTTPADLEVTMQVNP